MAAGALAAAFILDANSAEAESDALEILRQKIQNTQTAVKDQAAAHQDSLDAISTSAEENQELIGTLNNLVSAYDGSASSAAEIQQVIDQLNQSVPGLNLSFNETNGTLSQTSEEIEKLVNQMVTYDELTEAISNKNETKITMTPQWKLSGKQTQPMRKH